MSIELLVEYVLIEDYGKNIMNFIENELGKFTLLEHFQSFYRFKLDSNITIAKLFGSFEDSVNILFYFFFYV